MASDRFLPGFQTHDIETAADTDARLRVLQVALWAALGTVGQLDDVLETWREKAFDVRGRALDGGHTLQEEAPEDTLHALLGFLA